MGGTASKEEGERVTEPVVKTDIMFLGSQVLLNSYYVQYKLVVRTR